MFPQKLGQLTKLQKHESQSKTAGENCSRKKEYSPALKVKVDLSEETKFAFRMSFSANLNNKTNNFDTPNG